MYEIEIFSKRIDFINLIYYFKGGSGPKNSISFNGPLDFYKIIKNSY